MTKQFYEGWKIGPNGEKLEPSQRQLNAEEQAFVDQLDFDNFAESYTAAMAGKKLQQRVEGDVVFTTLGRGEHAETWCHRYLDGGE